MGRIVGIDLGTSFTRAAVMEGGEPRLLTGAGGLRAIPSIVSVSDSGEILLGAAARRHAIAHPGRTIPAAKRLLGRRYDSPEMARLRESLPYRIVTGASGEARVRLGDVDVCPTEIVASVLAKVKATAEESLGEQVKDVVVGVPAFFHDGQRQAVKDAGRVAGLNVVRLVNEATAAALAYGVGRTGEEKIAIFDFGGGKVDVSVLEVGDGVFQVRGESGEALLGGWDLDDRIADHLGERFLKERGLEIRTDGGALARLREAAERARVELTSAEETEVNVPFLLGGPDGPGHLKVALSRATVEPLIEDLLDRAVVCCRAALEEAGVAPGGLDRVILAGGVTRMPRVREKVRQSFGCEPTWCKGPDEIVALGTAVQAGVLSGDVKEILLLDVAAHSLGIETQGAVFTRLIDKNMTIPTRKGRVFSTAVDNQSTVEIHVLQGEGAAVAENCSLGRFELVGLPPSPRGIPQIEVAFEIDSDGIVHVSAKDLGTGQAQSIRALSAPGLTDEEETRIVDAARGRGESDRKGRDLARARSNLDGLLYSVERHLKGASADMGAGSSRLEEEVKRAKSVLAAASGEEVAAEVDALARVYHEMLSARATRPAGG